MWLNMKTDERTSTYLSAAINNSLIAPKPPQQEGNLACYWKPSQLPGDSEIMDLQINYWHVARLA